MTAIILAAGRSSRFGSQKLLAPFRGEPMIRHVVKTISAAGLEECILVYADEQVKAAVPDVRCVHNPDAVQGQSTSIRLSVSRSDPETDGYLFLMGDQPFLSSETIRTLLAAFHASSKSIVVPVYAGKQGAPVVFAGRWRAELLALQGDTGGRQIMCRHTEEILRVSIACAREGLDIDTVEVYRREVEREGAQEP